MTLARLGSCLRDELKEYDEPRRRADHAQHGDGQRRGRRDRVWWARDNSGQQPTADSVRLASHGPERIEIGQATAPDDGRRGVPQPSH